VQKGLLGYMQKVLDPDQPPCLRRRIWSGSTLFLHSSVQQYYFSSCV